MFLIPTYVRPSEIAGVGVFTPEPIPAGTTIWEFTPGVDLELTDAELSAIPEPLQSKIRSYCYRDGPDHFVLCGDQARFMNHSFEPNCDDIEGPCTVTKRDIEAGEELTCDYRLFDLDSREDGLDHWRTDGHPQEVEEGATAWHGSRP